MSSDLKWIKVLDSGVYTGDVLDGVLTNYASDAMVIPITPGIDYVIENLSNHDVQVSHAGRLFLIESNGSQKFCNDPATLARKPDDPVAVPDPPQSPSWNLPPNSSFDLDFTDSGTKPGLLIEEARANRLEAKQAKRYLYGWLYGMWPKR